MVKVLERRSVPLLLLVVLFLSVIPLSAAKIIEITMFNVYPRKNVYVGDRIHVEVQIRNVLQFDVEDVTIEIEVKGDVSMISEGTKHFAHFRHRVPPDDPSHSDESQNVRVDRPRGTR